MNNLRWSEKRRYDGNNEHPSKKPRLDHSRPHPGQFHQGNSNGNNKQSQPFNKVNSKSSKPQNRSDAPPKRVDPLPPLPPISETYSKLPFTHPSRTPREFELNVMQSYDRLEFLGDAYIEIIASRLIWSLYKNLHTGQMASIRERLVKNETLAEFSVWYSFDKRIDIEPASAPPNRHAQVKLYGDVFEAYVASIVLSDPVNGFVAAEEWLTKLWMPMLEDVQGKPPDDGWKERLRGTVGGKGVKLDYLEERPMLKGKGIETYFIGVYLTGWGYENQLLGSGQGLSKKAAGMEAAQKALENKTLISEIGKIKDAKTKEYAEPKKDTGEGKQEEAKLDVKSDCN